MFLSSGMLRTSILKAGSIRVTPSATSLLHRFFSGSLPKNSQDKASSQGEASTSATDTTTAAQDDALQANDDYTGHLYDSLPISYADISRAEVAIRGGVKRTACEHSPFISELVGANVYFKPEFRQYTGSFKERGARNAILQLRREKKDKLRGVIAAR